MRTASPWLCLAVLLSACDAQVSEPGSKVVLPLPEAGKNFAPHVLDFRCAPATGDTPFTTRCSWRVADPERAPVHCRLDVDGDGAMETEISDCTQPGALDFTFGSPGDFTARLEALDGPGAVGAETFVLHVTGRPNSAPVIDTFTVTPEVGFAVMKAAFKWTLSDAEKDPLSCTLDVQGDGKADYTFAACELSGAQEHAFDLPGVYEAKLVVTDRFKATRERTVRVEVKKPQGEVKLLKVEWGQSVFAETLRLVEGKKALLKATVLGDRATLQGVQVKMEGFRGGTSLGALPVKGPDTLPLTETPGDLSKAFVATVPEDWMAPGLEVTVTADATELIGETNEMDNVRTLKPTVGTGTELHLTDVPFVASSGAGPTGVPPASYPDLLYKVWPLKRINSARRAPFTVSYAIGADANTWTKLLDDITSLRTADKNGRYYYGWVKVTYTAGILGIANLPGPAAIGVDGLPGKPEEGPGTLAHELGHTFNRRHVRCNGNEGGPDTSYPTAGGKIAEWGVDLLTMELKSPSVYADTMSYCRPPWASKYGYDLAQRFLESNPPKAALVAGSSSSLQLLVSGRIVDGEVLLNPIQVIASSASEPPASTDYVARLITDRGSVTQVPFGVYEMADVEPATVGFAFTVPDVGALAAIELRREGTVLLRREAIATSAASLQRLLRGGAMLEVRWTPGSHLLVAHLGGDGARTTLATDLTAGEALLPIPDLPEGGQFEVSLSDGLNAVRSVLLRR